jgi:hypothetical protein
LAKRGLRRATPGPDRAKPRQGAGTRSVDTREQGMGAGAMAHTPIARPCRAASRCGWHTLPGWRWHSAPLAPVTCATSALPHHGVPSGSGYDAVRQPETLVVLRRKGRTFADQVLVAPVIGCVLPGVAGDCDRPRQDRLPGIKPGFWRCFD